jgi:hypothetical protein
MARNVFSRYGRARSVAQSDEAPWEPAGEQDGVTYGETQTLGAEPVTTPPAEQPPPA